MDKTRLVKFRVQNYRSISDSGWIESEKVGCLVGTNESGKTNVLLALWKLNPANDEPIIPLIDYPRKKYHDYDKTGGKEVFITAEIQFSDSVAIELSELSGWHKKLVRNVIISRKYNGEYEFQFSKNKIEDIEKEEIDKYLQELAESLERSELKDKESEEVFSDLIDFTAMLPDGIASKPDLFKQDIIDLKEKVGDYLATKYSRKKNINSFFDHNFFEYINKLIRAFDENGITVNEDCEDIIRRNMPNFVYYSDYGNLDSEIYLPHVIENFDRDDLGEIERAKTRSLKVLFEFVNLSPKQILELGKEALPTRVVTKDNRGNVSKEEIEEPTNKDIESEREKKKEREILLQSASNSLTEKFKDWWKQGNYKFRFQADGNHFRIWVSDEKRSEEIELEGRSRGLQWFFSFFLVFLVESRDTHANCILLLDEPGLSLHPLAQFDLTEFFNSLSNENQIIYTTHSPFLVNPNNLTGVYATYIGENGESVISPDLRANKKIAEKSIYPVHAAIGITISDTLLIGCQPVLVEGHSDQIYLQLIKTYVFSEGKFKNDQELVFVPTGGVRGMSPVIKILLGRDNDLPYVIMDSDNPGKQKTEQLRNNLYKDEKEKVIGIDRFLGEGEYEIEDLMPKDALARIFAKEYRRVKSDDEFDYMYDPKLSIVDQMEVFARENGYQLELGWKVDLAKDFRRNFDRIITRTDEELKKIWVEIIDKLTSNSSNSEG